MTAAADDPAPYRDAAMLYRNADWAAPIPVVGKYPPPKGWTGADGMWPSGADIFSWLEDRPADNIGLRLPPDVLGIDVDAYGDKRGAQTLADCEAAWGPLPATWRSTSRDDGISGIRLYRIPEGKAWPGQLPGGGVELVRWDHRYAMVWPSIHPEGRIYRWTRDGVTALNIPRADELPRLPVDWLIGLIKGPERHEDKADIGSGATWVAGLTGARDAMCPVMASALLKAQGELRTSGSRHDTMTHAQLDLVRLAEMGHPGGVHVLDGLGELFVSLVAPDRGGDSVIRQEYVRALDGACARVAAAPSWPPGHRDPCTVGTTPRMPPAYDRTDSSWTDAASEGSAAEATSGGRAAISTWGERVDVSAALDGRLPAVPPSELARVDGVPLLYPGKVNGLLGPSESGKTWVALLAAMQAMQAGRSVVILDFEDTVIGMVERLRALGVPDETIRSHITYLAPAEPLTLVTLADLMQVLADVGPALVILDGVNAAMSTMGLELNSNTDATNFHINLLLPMSKSGAAVVVVDHTPKNDAEGISKGGIGAQAKRAAMTGAAIKVEVIKQFSRSHAGLLKLTVDKDRGGHVRMAAINGVIGMAHLEPGENGTLSVRIEPQEPAENEAGEFRPTVSMGKVAEYLMSHPGANSREIKYAKLGRETYVRDAVEALVADGYVSRTTGPNRQLFHTLIRVYPSGVSMVSPSGIHSGVSLGVSGGVRSTLRTETPGAVGAHLGYGDTHQDHFEFGSEDPADE